MMNSVGMFSQMVISLAAMIASIHFLLTGRTDVATYLMVLGFWADYRADWFAMKLKIHPLQNTEKP